MIIMFSWFCHSLLISKANSEANFCTHFNNLMLDETSDIILLTLDITIPDILFLICLNFSSLELFCFG